MRPRSRRRELLAGMRDESPLLLGVMPFGMIYGALAVQAGLPPLMAQAMSLVIFAGSSQFVTTQLLAAGAPALVMIATGAVVNLRHMLYSASLAPHVRHLNRAWRALLSYLLTDEAYAVAITRYADAPSADAPRGEGDHRHWYVLGAGLALWATWQSSTAAGVFLGGRIPAEWGLDFALPLTFIAILVPALKNRANIAAAAVGGLVAVAAAGAPLKTGLLIAALAGIAAGALAQRVSSASS